MCWHWSLAAVLSVVALHAVCAGEAREPKPQTTASNTYRCVVERAEDPLRSVGGNGQRLVDEFLAEKVGKSFLIDKELKVYIGDGASNSGFTEEPELRYIRERPMISL